MPINHMETTNCSFCQEEKAELILITRDIAFDNPGEFPLVSCSNCNLLYLQTRPSPQDIGAYYPPEYLPYRTAIQDEPLWIMRWMRQRNIGKRVAQIEAAVSIPAGHVLDVGCSTGIFLDAMRTAGWDTLGIEISPDAAAYARKRFNLDVLPGQLLDHQLLSESFDAITFWDVLEHTFDPFENLKETNRLLKKGGIVALTIPHWESVDRKLFGPAWIGFDSPRHLFVFPRETLLSMLDASGFQIEKAWTGFGGYYTLLASLRLWLKIKLPNQRLRLWIMKFFDFPGVRLIFQPFFSLLDSQNLGGTLVMIARKTRDLDLSQD
jgi:SAM-dependent methyltransferase